MNFFKNSLSSRVDNFGSCMFEKVCKGSTSMSSNTRNLIIHEFDKSGKNCRVVAFLETMRDVISELSNSMSCSVSDLGISVFKVLKKNWNHRINFFCFLYVFSDLRECHDSRVFEAPILLVCDSVLNKSSNKREHGVFSNA